MCKEYARVKGIKEWRIVSEYPKILAINKVPGNVYSQLGI